MSFSQKIFFCFLPWVMMACKAAKNEEVAVSPLVSSDVALADVSLGKCLSVEKLSRVLQDPAFSVPAALMTSNLIALSEIPISKLNYFSYASFSYRSNALNEMGLFSSTRQKDCKTVQTLSASEEVLTFDVISYSESEITLKLKDKFRDDMMSIQKTSLFERQQIYEVTYKYVTPHHLAIIEKYKTVDPICASKKSVSFEVYKELFWASRESDLPQSYTVNAKYLNQVKEAITSESLSLISSPENSDEISLDTILKIQKAPVKEELKLCSP